MRDLSGQTFGSYRLESVIGRGGMGEVYRARHLRLTNRLAAVKVLPASLAIESDFLQRFEHEANSAASLDHPAILPVWDYGEHEGQPYLAMPFIPGGSLKEYLEQHGPLSPAEALGLFAPIAEALDYAHSRGIIHRDVKPANILLREDGRPLLADFGIAKAVESGQSQGLTRAGSTIGTPEYMAPEQIEGKAEPRSDLYSLGVVLYQMLTGHVPYEGGTPYEIAYKQMHTPLPPARWLRQDLSPALENVLASALTKDPALRYPSGKAFAAAFREALAGGAGATAIAPGIPQATQRLDVAGGTTPLVPPPPYAAPPPRPPVGAPVPVIVPAGHGAAGYPPQGRGANRAMIGALIVVFLVAVGLLGIYLAFFAIPGPTPTPTINAAGTQAARGTATANAAQQNAANATRTANAGAAAQATQEANAAATATAQQGEQDATATAAANAQNAATATAATNAAATANVVATANAAATANTVATETARVNTAATATVAANATGTANASAAQTATVAARPSATAVPPTATAAPPTQTARPPTQAPAAPTQTPAANWGPALAPLSGGKVYGDPEDRFTFSVPNNWSERESNTSAVAFGSPGTQATVSVNLTDAPGGTDIEALNNALAAQVQEQNGYAAVSLDKVVVDSQPAYRRVYRVTNQGQQVQVVQVYFIKGSTAHILTFATLASDFSQFSRTFDGIAGSYKAGNT